jgi:putative addiction module component (TIGR02574 family)
MQGFPMSLTETELLSEAMKLDPQARTRIAGILMESVDPVAAEPLSPAWDLEIQRRLYAFDRGETQAIPGKQVLDELLRRNDDSV